MAASKLRKGRRVRILRHPNERVAGRTGEITEMVRPSGLVPRHPGSAWVRLDGYRTEAHCSRDDLEVM